MYTFVEQVSHTVKVEANKERFLETLVDRLQTNARVTKRQDVASIESPSFLRFCRQFVQDVAHLTRNLRNLLMLNDGHRSHLGLRSLQILREGNVICYELPSHAHKWYYKATRPICISILKRSLLGRSFKVHTTALERAFDIIDFANCMSEAYVTPFTVENSSRGFEKLGLHHPLETTKLRGRGFAASSSTLNMLFNR